MTKILVIHGANLNLLGLRNPDAYGTATLEEVDAAIRAHAESRSVEVEIHQTQHEGVIVELLHGGIDRVDGAVINPGGYSHTSRVIEDAIYAVPYPVVEVHMTNIHAVPPTPISFPAMAALGVVAGFKQDSYVLGLDGVIAHLARADATG